MDKELLQEVFDVIKAAKCTKAVYTTHDQDVMLTAKQEILEALKQKWPQEAATLNTYVPTINKRLSTF